MADNANAVKVVSTVVDVKVAKDPEQRTGLRGLRGLVFGEFRKAYDKTHDLKKLPDQETMTKLVAASFPQSRWIARPKVHYGYYKSKFITSMKPKEPAPKA